MYEGVKMWVAVSCCVAVVVESAVLFVFSGRHVCGMNLHCRCVVWWAQAAMPVCEPWTGLLVTAGLW